MTTLDQVMDMKSRGISDKEIINGLQEQGITPGEITNAMSQAQIKSAVSEMSDPEIPSSKPTSNVPKGMQHSILGPEGEPDRLPTEGNINDADLTPPVPGGFTGNPQMPMYLTKEISGSNQGEEMYNPQEVYYQPPQYQQPNYPQQDQAAYAAGYGYSPAPEVMDTDTMIEIAEQVFSEKNKPLQKKIDEISEFKTIAQSNLDYISDRLKKIETIIDKLQASILEKVGSYGYGLESIKKEMGMMQDSFGKMVGNIADKSEERQRSNRENNQGVTIQRSKKTTRKFSKR